MSPEIEKLWVVEVETRVAAFERGEIEAIDAEDVFAEIDSTKAAQLNHLSRGEAVE